MPVQIITEASTTLRDLLDAEPLEEVLDPLDDYYVLGRRRGGQPPMFPPKIWNVHERVLQRIPR